MAVTKSSVPFLDLRAQQARIKDDLRRRLDAVLAHCQFILGPEVAELETELARFCGAKHCVSVSSGTDALQIAMMAENIGRGGAFDVIPTSPGSRIAWQQVKVVPSVGP